MSISLSPGPLNTDISGYTGSFFNRLKLLLLAALCVMVKGREVLALAEERPEDETSAQGRPSWVSATTTRYRAITSLYAGTAFSASKLNGKVKVFFGPPEFPSLVTTDLTPHCVKCLFFILVSHRLGARHTSE